MQRNAQTLSQIGQAMFGPNWQAPLSEAIKVSDRSIRKWLAGDPIPEGVWTDVHAVCLKRAEDLLSLAQALRGPDFPSQVMAAPSPGPRRPR